MAASASRIVFYAKGSGVPRVQTARIDSNGNLVVLQSYLNGKIGNQEIGQWTHLVATNDTFFFYNQDRHAGLVARVQVDGSLALLKRYAPGNVKAITRLVATATRVFAYDGADKSGTVFTFESDGSITNLKSYAAGNVQDLTDFVATDSTVFGYNRATHSGTVFTFEADGTITNVKTYSPGNVQDVKLIAGTSVRLVLFQPPTRVIVARINGDGSINNLSTRN